MPVRISETNIQSLGPIQNRLFEFTKLNLIFGHNESGKSLLVEFFLKSLFSHSGTWNLRSSADQGKVVISGISKFARDFTPGTEKKLEDYWQEHDRGFPLNLAQLLVIKGGESGLSPNHPGEISKNDLKALLTRETLLSEISNRIQTTVQKAKIINGQIQGENRGDIKELFRLRRESRRLSNILEEVELSYSRGPLQENLHKQNKIQARLQAQEKARLHHAFQISSQQKELIKKKEALPDDVVENLGNMLTNHRSLKAEISNLKQKIIDITPKSESYLWLNEAISTWQDQELGTQQHPHRALQVFALSALIAGLITLLLTQFYQPGYLVWLAIGLIVTGVGLSWVHSRKISIWAIQKDKNNERTALKRHYTETFNDEINSLTDLKKSREIYRKYYYQIETFSQQLEEKNTDLENLSNQIITAFSRLNYPETTPSTWKTSYQDLLSESRELTKEIQFLSTKLAALGVPESNYLEHPSQISYSEKELRQLSIQLSNLQAREDELLKDQQLLKQRICDETGDPIDTIWPDLLNSLQELSRERKDTLKKQTAGIISGIGITHCLDQIRELEDAHIRRNIQSSQVTKLINSLTGSQLSLDIENDQLISSSKYQNFPINELSTGTREQVHLALRMGLASIISGGEPLFLILDDAFQHSDWERREQLVAKTIQMALQGWQIIYLTMDDHLKNLFNARGKTALGEEYTFFSLD